MDEKTPTLDKLKIKFYDLTEIIEKATLQRNQVVQAISQEGVKKPKPKEDSKSK